MAPTDDAAAGLAAGTIRYWAAAKAAAGTAEEPYRQPAASPRRWPRPGGGTPGDRSSPACCIRCSFLVDGHPVGTRDHADGPGARRRRRRGAPALRGGRGMSDQYDEPRPAPTRSPRPTAPTAATSRSRCPRPQPPQPLPRARPTAPRRPATTGRPRRRRARPLRRPVAGRRLRGRASPPGGRRTRYRGDEGQAAPQPRPSRRRPRPLGSPGPDATAQWPQAHAYAGYADPQPQAAAHTPVQPPEAPVRSGSPIIAPGIQPAAAHRRARRCCSPAAAVAR